MTKLRRTAAFIMTAMISVSYVVPVWAENINITMASASAQTTEESSWKETIAERILKNSDGGWFIWLDVDDLKIPSDNREALEQYIDELRFKDERYYWIDYVNINLDDDNSIIGMITVVVKEQYLSDDWSTVNKEQAASDYRTLHERLDKGEWKEVMAERLDYGFNSVLDLKIPQDKAEEFDLYIDELRAEDENYYWIDGIWVVPGEMYLEEVYAYVKDEYLNDDWSIDKTQAVQDYRVLQERLKNGEWKEIVAERLQKNNSIYVYDLGISEDNKTDIYEIAQKSKEYSWTDNVYTSVLNSKISYVEVTYWKYTDWKDSGELSPEQEIIDYYTVLEKRIASLKYQMRDDMTDLEKILLVHEWVVRECEYDFENYLNNSIPVESYMIYGFIDNALVVCDGYTRVMKTLLNRFGIENYRVSSEELNHAWNVVNLDGNWYNLDATWDDWGKDEDSEGRSYTEYFLLSDKEIGRDDRTGDMICADDNSYQGYIFRNNYYHARNFNYYDGNWYYINSAEGKIVKSKIDGTEASVFKSIDKNETYYINMFIYRDNMYIATRKNVITVDMKNPEKETVIFSAENEEGFENGIDEFVIKMDRIKIDSGENSKIISLEPVSSIKLDSAEVTVQSGSTYMLNATATSSIGSRPEWASSNSDVVSVDESGKITGKSSGTATVFATIDGKIASCTVTVKQEYTLIYGDANGDGEVNIKDAVMLKKHLAGYPDLKIDLAAADVNGDGGININDAVRLLRSLAGDTVVLGK